MRLRSLRKRERALIVIAVVIVVFSVISARLFLWPPTDSPASVDAVVALGGDPGQRNAYEAIALADSGYAPIAVISLGGEPPAPCPRSRKIRVACFRANPLDTRGEAEYVATLAAHHGWTRLIIVPERTQTTRARLLFERCTTATLLWVPVSDPVSRLAYDVVYEWAALFKALVVKPAC
ncbi:MAG TPA: hypothetical protein VED63_12005 [Acidimicrobiales bacterium]|nr:hypothetical protein [Acidimicrobiales bacterium]